MKQYVITVETEDYSESVTDVISTLMNIPDVTVTFKVVNTPMSIEELVDSVKNLPGGHPPKAEIIARRKKVLKMINAGKSRTDIAESLGVTLQTVSNDRRVLIGEGRL